MTLPSRLKPVRRNTLTSQVVDRVREFIFSNGLRPGDRLPSEEALARQLRVSRPTVRQALKALDVGGLISSQPRVGTVVSEFSYNQVVDVLAAHFHLSGTSLYELMEARCALEYSALPMAIERITPQQIETMRQIEEQYEADLDRGGHESARIDEAFHAVLLEATGNRVLASFIGLIVGFFRHPRHVELLETQNFGPERRSLTIKHHRELIEAIAQGELQLADSILRRHFEKTLALLAADDAARKAAS